VRRITPPTMPPPIAAPPKEPVLAEAGLGELEGVVAWLEVGVVIPPFAVEDVFVTKM
jgi:hypothetical protein